MFITLRQAGPDTADNQKSPDIYLYSDPQHDLYIPSPTWIYTKYFLNLAGFLAMFYLVLNQVVKFPKK